MAASIYVQGQIDLESADHLLGFWNYIGPHIRKIKDIDESTQARWLYGAARMFGFNRRQISTVYTRADVFTNTDQYNFIKAYYPYLFHPPSSSLHQREPDHTCPAEWEPFIKTGKLHTYLSRERLLSSESSTEEAKTPVALRSSAEPDKVETVESLKKTVSFYQGLCAAQSIVTLVLLIHLFLK